MGYAVAAVSLYDCTGRHEMGIKVRDEIGITVRDVKYDCAEPESEVYTDTAHVYIYINICIYTVAAVSLYECTGRHEYEDVVPRESGDHDLWHSVQGLWVCGLGHWGTGVPRS